MINFVVDNQKSVVGILENLNIYWLILRIMFLQIEFQIF